MSTGSKIHLCPSCPAHFQDSIYGPNRRVMNRGPNHKLICTVCGKSYTVVPVRKADKDDEEQESADKASGKKAAKSGGKTAKAKK